MKITSIELEEDIDLFVLNKIRDYREKYGNKPTVLIISKPLYDWFRKTSIAKSLIPWREELNMDLMTFDCLNIILTCKDNIIEVY